MPSLLVSRPSEKLGAINLDRGQLVAKQRNITLVAWQEQLRREPSPQWFVVRSSYHMEDQSVRLQTQSRELECSNTTCRIHKLQWHIDISRCYLTLDSKPSHIVCRGYLEEHIIINVKFHFPSIRINIALLVTLNGVESISDSANLYYSFLDNLGTHGNMLIWLCLTQGWPT